jgi:GxxExxY protein
MEKKFDEKDYPFKEETYILIGIAMEIHRQLGKGFLEIVYKDAFEYELQQRNIFYQREREFAIEYKNTILPHKFYADFIIDEKVILEIKSKEGIVDTHYAQVLNYLACSKLQIGLIMNFHDNSLQYKRVILTK